MSTPPRNPYRTPRILLLAGLVLMSAALTQCKMVTDATLAPQAGLAAAGDCIKACAETANAAIRVESELHVQNVKACGDDAECLALEELRHEAAVATIQEQRKFCQSSCHHQGGGKGGR